MRSLALILALFGAPQESGVRSLRRVQELAREVVTRDEAASRSSLEQLREFLPELRVQVFDVSSPGQMEVRAFIVASTTLANATPSTGADEEPWIELYEEAIEAAALYDDGNTEASLQIALCQRLRDEGQLDRARERLEEAVDFFADSVWLPAMYLDLAQIELYAGQYQEADQWLDEAESVLDPELSDHRLRECTLWGLRGQVLLLLGLPDQAMPWFRKEQERASASGVLALDFASQLHMADVRMAQDQWQQAERELLAVLETPGLADGSTIQGQLLVRLGRAQTELEHREPGREPRAAATLRRVLSIGSLPLPSRLSATLVLADSMIRSGNLSGAPSLLANAQQLFDNFQANNGKPADEAGRLASLKSRLLRRGGEGDAIEIHAQLETAWHDLLEDWATSPERDGGIGYLHFGAKRQTVLQELVRLTLEVRGTDQGTRESLEHLMQGQARGTLARQLEAVSGTLDQIRDQLLPERGGLLIYVGAPDGSVGFAIDRQSVLTFDMPGLGEMEEARQEMLRLVTVPPSRFEGDDLDRFLEDRQRAVDRVAAWLVPSSIHHRVDLWESVQIDGLDMLGYVPFEWLDGPGGVSLASKATSYLPSLTVGLRLRELDASNASSTDSLAEFGEPEASKPSSESPEFWLLTSPTYHPSTSERWPSVRGLELGDDDWQPWIECYGESRTAVFSGQAADPSCLEDPRLAEGKVLQLLTHGVYDSSRERPAGLAFAKSDDSPGVVWCRDVESWSVPPVVLLTACGAARGPLRRGDDGVTHLGGAFLRAGARTVLLARADLEQHATAQLMGEFHRAFRDGASPAEALRQARFELRDSTGYADPFYSSLVHVHGLGQLPSYESGSRRVEAKETPALRFLGPLVLVALISGLVVWGICSRFVTR